MKKLFSNFEEIIAGCFLIITVSSVVLNVVCRSIGLGTISTSEEIATISFVWSVYIGAVACYKKKSTNDKIIGNSFSILLFFTNLF